MSLLIAILAALALAPSPGAPGSDTVSPESPPASADSCAAAAATVSAGSVPQTSEADLPAWQTIDIVDIDGVTFTLADCVGTPVLVELFATWCSNCRQQLPKTNEAAAAMGEQAAVIALSVETDLAPEAVAEYAADNEFSQIRFAVVTPELLAAFVEAFGNAAANPPSVPKIVIDADGVAGGLTTGQESTEELVDQLTATAGRADTTTNPG